MRSAFDFSPLYHSTIGFDRLADMLNTAQRVEQIGGFPPYNVERTGADEYRITMAVAGFSSDELELTAEPNKLTVRGQKSAEERQDSEYLYRGIAARTFEQTFNLADHVKVVGASLEHGLLAINLAREIPEALKPRNVEIHSASGGSSASRIEHDGSETANSKKRAA